MAVEISTDAVVAIGQGALNKGWAKMFGGDGTAATIEFSGQDWEMTGTRIAAPQISFLPLDQSRARLTLKFLAGTFTRARYVIQEKRVEETHYDLTGRKLSFEVKLNRMEMPDFHDSGFTTQALYLGLTNVSNIDALSMGFDSDDLASIGEVVKGVVQHIQSKSGADQSLIVGRVRVPKVPDTSGPLAPTAAALAATCAPDQPEFGELDFLLMMRGRRMPPAASELTQRGLSSPIMLADGAAGQDAALVLSDRALLEAFAVPVLRNAFSGIKLELSPPDADGRSTLRQTEVLSLKERGMTAENATARLEGDKIHLSVDLSTRERLQTDDGPDGVDFSLVEVILRKTLRYDLELKVGQDGLLTFDLKEDKGNRDDPVPEFKPHFEINELKDIVKYLVAPLAVIAGPFAAPFVIAFVAVVEGIAIAIQAGIADVLDMKQRGSTGLGPVDDIATHLELPGDPVFGFTGVRAATNAVLIGADYVDPPELLDGTTAPYSIRPFPRVNDGEPLPADRTAPELIGEVALKYRYVNDPRFSGENRSNMPYYILRREQFWKRTSSHEYPAQAEQRTTIETMDRVSSTHQESMTNTLSAEVSATGTLELFDGFAPELKTEFKNELVVSVEDTTEREHGSTITREITLQPREDPFGISVWVMVERYTLMRGDRSVVNQWDFPNADYVHIDDYLLASRTLGEGDEELELEVDDE